MHKKALKHPQNPHHRQLSGHFSIFICATFAWFTSKDEVTNRLSANADYGVKIVESFAPPANWIPGQTVNKDVYALNTGSVEAFVNEDVSGVLTYTVVQKTETRDAQCVKLTADEVDAVKAGAFLAGAFKANGDPMRTGAGTTVDPYVYDPELGNIAEYFNNGKGTDPKTTEDFTPTASGLYIFRRTIDVGTTAPYAETFTYDGYYFDKDTNSYYKLAEVKTNSYVGANADDRIGSDGVLTAAPKVIYLKEKQAQAVPALTYEAAVTGSTNPADDHQQRLVATIKTGTDATLNGASVDSLAIAADGALETLNDKKAALETAKQNLENASSAYQVALDTIAYYAGATNAKTIVAGDLNDIDATEDFTSFGAKTVAKIVGGVTKTKLDNYNAVQAKWAALGAAPTVDDTAMTGAKDDMDNSLADFESKKAAYEAAAGYPYTSPVTNPDPADALYVVWTAENKYEADKTAYETAKAAYDSSVAAKAEYDAKKAEYEAQMNSYAAAIVSDVTAIKAAITKRDNQNPETAGHTQPLYNTALSEYNAALGAYETALAAYNSAAAYQVALDNDTEIVIYINLSDDVITSGTAKDKWLLAPVADGTAAAGASANDTVAHFYYTTALAGGQSTAKLIDSVTLSDKTTQNDYKDFDFDLNVKLDSAQVTYDDTNSDGKLYSGKATNTAAFDGYKADFVAPTNITSIVVWTPTT